MEFFHDEEVVKKKKTNNGPEGLVGKKIDCV